MHGGESLELSAERHGCLEGWGRLILRLGTFCFRPPGTAGLMAPPPSLVLGNRQTGDGDAALTNGAPRLMWETELCMKSCSLWGLGSFQAEGGPAPWLRGAHSEVFPVNLAFIQGC